MKNKLVQKHLLKGSREFELVDDAVNVRIKTPLSSEEFTVVLSILDPEPVVRGSRLAFESVVNREALIEFYLDKPNPQEFNAFISKIKQRTIAEDFGKPREAKTSNRVSVEQLQATLDMLRSYLDDDDIKPFLDSLEALKADPENQTRLTDVFAAFNQLGPRQGAVLTYAPYMVSLMSDDE
jgi:hypothetical protein